MRFRPLLVTVNAALLSVLVAALASGCGAGKSADSGGPGARAAPAKDGGDAGAADAADAAPPPKPFAGSAAAATDLMAAAVEKKGAQVLKCVTEYRARKNLPHERITITMGIDQEGRLLGATLPKSKADAPLSACVQAALADAPFPRSHSGVISITKSYEEIVQ